MKIDFTIDQKDIQALFAATGDCYKNTTLQAFTNYCEAGYEEYCERQQKLNQNTKTYTQWINGQIISLT